MKIKIIALIGCILLLVGSITISAFSATNTEDIVILYENDVHCVIEGYSKLSAMKKELAEEYAHVGVVSGGDFIQGNSLGVITKGEYIVEIMNLIGYDAVTLGNHEFDYTLDRLEELVDMMDTKPICCNFQRIGEDGSYFEPYSIVSYGDVDVAYIGITTPSTIHSTFPAQFKDENGNFIYSFNQSTLYETVQNSINAVKAQGADYVIAISHIGYAEDEIYGDMEDIETLIANTEGFDVVLDAHSHTVIEEKKIIDKGGNSVHLSSTGTKFEYIGKLTLSKGGIETELIKSADYQQSDPVVDDCIEQIYAEYAVLADRKIASSEVDLIINDENGNRLVRNTETNLGDLIADSLRYVMDADIGYMNGGGIRKNIPVGDITFSDLLNVLPFNNTVALAEVSGKTIMDMLEMATRSWPNESGSFPHLSGIEFSVNTAILSSVVLDEFENFSGVSGEYRVYDIKVYNSETEKYEPLSLTETYTLAATAYFLVEYGSGMKMLEEGTVIRDEGMLDVVALETYINEKLGGTIGSDYSDVKANITFTEGKPAPDTGSGNTGNIGESADNNDSAWLIVGISAGGAVVLAAVVVAAVIVLKKKNKKS